MPFHYVGVLGTLYNVFRPFSLLGRVLRKIKLKEVSDALIIAPFWPTAHWYPQVLELLVRGPILLPQWDRLLTLPQEAFLESWFPLSSLGLKQLTLKTVALVAFSFCSKKSDIIGR